RRQRLARRLGRRFHQDEMRAAARASETLGEGGDPLVASGEMLDLEDQQQLAGNEQRAAVKGAQQLVDTGLRREKDACLWCFRAGQGPGVAKLREERRLETFVRALEIERGR